MNTINQANPRGQWPKVCVNCAKNGTETVLNPGVNCYLSMFKNAAYQCKSCKAKQSQVEHTAKWQLPWFRAKKLIYLTEYHNATPAAVYAVYYDMDIIYIGESAKPEQRRVAHFSKHIKKDISKWQNKISYDLATAVLDRNRLSFDVIEYVQDKKERMVRDRYHLDQHKLAFGDYPKYNLDYTGRKRHHLVDKRKG